MNNWHRLASTALLAWTLTVGGLGSAAAQTKT